MTEKMDICFFCEFYTNHKIILVHGQLCLQNFYAPTLKGWHLDLPLSVCPKMFNFVTKVEKCRHPCSIDIF